TILWMDGTSALFFFGKSSSGNFTNGWSAGYGAGRSNITVTSASGLSVGHIISLDQTNDLAIVDPTGDEDPSGFPSGRVGTDIGNGGTLRSTPQHVEITAINGNDLTVWPPVYWDVYDGTRLPEFFHFRNDDGYIRYIGLENFTV